MIERLLYELSEVTDEAVVVEVQSAYGTITWEQTIAVDRLVHDERLSLDSDPEKVDLLTRYGDRVGRIARGAAWNRFVDYLGRMALNAGLEWLLLNLEANDYAFLFSTRKQNLLAEALGHEAGTLHTPEQQLFILTDRRVPAETCYCIKTGNYRLFARYEFVPGAMRVFLSDYVRIGPRANLAQIEAEKAIHFLRTMRHGRMEPAQFVRMGDDVSPSFTVSGTRMQGAETSLSHPSQPGGLPIPDVEDASEALEPAPDAMPNAMPDVMDEPDGVELDADEARDAQPTPTECPNCGAKLFGLSDVELICLSCDWNNLDGVH